MQPFIKIFSELSKAKIKYLVVGGVAVNLHGSYRFTGDLDILLLLEKKNLKMMDNLMKKLGYSERLPISINDLGDHVQVKKWMKEKGMTAFSFLPPEFPLIHIDIIMKDSLNFKKAYEGRTLKKIDSVNIPVVSIDYLIKMKKEAKRPKDLIDIGQLLKLKKL